MGWTLIQHTALTSSAASVTLGSGGTIPQTYKTLKLLVSARSAYTGLVADDFSITFNAIGSGYSDRFISGNGSSAYSGTNGGGGSKIYLGNIPGNSTANTFSNGELVIPTYSGSTNKPVSVDNVSENNATESYQNLIAGLMSNTAAITSISISSNRGQNILSGSTFTLYGLA